MKRYQAAAEQIRKDGPMTIPELAKTMRWTQPATMHAVWRARHHLLLIVVGKLATGNLVFGAVQQMADRL